MHRKLTEHGRCYMQNKQLPINSYVKLEDNSMAHSLLVQEKVYMTLCIYMEVYNQRACSLDAFWHLFVLSDYWISWGRRRGIWLDIQILLSILCVLVIILSVKRRDYLCWNYNMCFSLIIPVIVSTESHAHMLVSPASILGKLHIKNCHQVVLVCTVHIWSVYCYHYTVSQDSFSTYVYVHYS